MRFQRSINVTSLGKVKLQGWQNFWDAAFRDHPQAGAGILVIKVAFESF